MVNIADMAVMGAIMLTAPEQRGEYINIEIVDTTSLSDQQSTRQ
jgi:hypothetical protein